MRKFINDYKKQAFAGILFILAYFPILHWMWDRWFVRDSYYSHGVLVPFVSCFLIWQIRDKLKMIKPKESPLGLPLIIIGLVIYLLSSLFRIYFSSGLSMLIVLYGMVLYFWGKEMFLKISFPLAFLLFMVPLPEVAIVNISFRLKMFATTLATWLLNHMRIPAVQQGSIIKMPTSEVIVDDVCSGLRSLISLMALGSIFAYWLKGPIIKRCVLFASAIPIAVITNVCRVLILASISEIWGPQYINHFVHDGTGFVVFALAFLLLYSIGKLLE
ncbi:MAG: exosortase/archaeosortase family protein [Candidatus Omnitrophica bacterium]|nr:exosortase/archaeosortase family protein [Candidatus Omnitrophota bacterium]